MGDIQLLAALAPVILLLMLGVTAALASRAMGLSPIVGYLMLGLGLRFAGLNMVLDGGTIAILAALGVVFLLFDIGLDFSFTHIRAHASDIFGLGPVQVLAGTMVFCGLALFAGFPLAAALIIGATLALSSTAVVARLIAERHQQNCPVGLTATAILIFQDVAAIFLLIVAGALETHTPLLPALGIALAKAAAAFGVALLLGRFVVRPAFAMIARSRNEEVFTGIALLVALAAGWATGSVGLSLTLGAFLGGMIIAETPYRVVVQSEIKPFRGLFLSFFFIAVGLSIDVAALLRVWPALIGMTAVLITAKIAANAAASFSFRWSAPGSTQLSFLLAQGSEFAFVILSLSPIRQLVGERASAVLIASVAISLAVTPTLAEAGRNLAGRMRLRRPVLADPELKPHAEIEPVFIAGMGSAGRTLADALQAFGIGYAAIERDDRRLRRAVADGYKVGFGDFADPRIWGPIALHGRRISVLTTPSFEVSHELSSSMLDFYPALTRIVIVHDEVEAKRFSSIGMLTVIDRSVPAGLDVAELVLRQLGVEPAKIARWLVDEVARSLGPRPARAEAA
ncbi:cation:proton antiporter domain-containing protein [Glacieibacterium megasporae]|uniref:cation:proton antiporter domain-containing protein n=1 Tax=Glacieibacterium megasporae TaxID=2835787 RepID=UPI001C1E6E69|nr:cation:proton antiporter [Polymorphobacter megasporae]UAJ10973.1 cation:proton antiporter [Polymorphobacter megasporae]